MKFCNDKPKEFPGHKTDNENWLHPRFGIEAIWFFFIDGARTTPTVY